MYIMSIEINQICNLNCRYCYLGVMNKTIMTEETGKKAIDFAFEKAKIHKDKKIWIEFIGGEALLSFDLLRDLVLYIELKNNNNYYSIFYSITTNGTLLTMNIVDWLVSKKFIISISIDGKPLVQRNRKYHNGKESYSDIVSNLEDIKEAGYFLDFIQVKHVITLNNYMYTFESIRHLVEELGFTIVDSLIDLSAKWKDEDLKRLTEQLEEGIKFYIQRKQNKNKFFWGLIYDMLKNIYCNKRFYKCGAGIVSCYVRNDGEIFACSANTCDEFSLGHVSKGINRNKIIALNELQEIKNESCEKCEICNKCLAKSCIMNSLKANNSINLPCEILCYLEKRKYELKQKYYNDICSF